MRLALFASILVAITCAIAGTFVVLRGLAFVGDALSHGVLPGIATALIFGVSCIGYTAAVNPSSNKNFVALAMSVLVAIYALSNLNISQLDSLLLLLVLGYFIYVMATQLTDSDQPAEISDITFLNLLI